MLKIGDRFIGDGHPVFITFEAGPTHSGVESAKRLIDIAADEGGHAVKFQFTDPDRIVADKSLMFEYEVLIDRETGKTEKVSEPLYDILCRRALSFDQWREVKAHADSKGLAFFATVSFPENLAFAESLNVASLKIASADVSHLPLLRLAARTGISIQLDTGNSTLGEIERAVDVLRSEGNEQIIIHQCPSGYPARLESINLRIIPTLKQMFGYPVAFSDHTPGWDMDIGAIALGANLVEKTITEDRTTRSVEHIMSLDPSDVRAFVTAINDLQIAFGTTRRIMTPEEVAKSIRMRRSVFLAQDVEAGQTLGSVKVDFRRPGDGIPPDLYEQMSEKTFRTGLPEGHKLSVSDFQ